VLGSEEGKAMGNGQFYGYEQEEEVERGLYGIRAKF
jgi:hypothetical protein